jgi:hypothetical protein
LARLALRWTRRVGVGLFPLLLALDLRAQQTSVVLPQQPQASAEIPTGTGAITGAVRDAATDRPVAGAIVMLEERQPGSPVRTRSYLQETTPKGRFAFLNLPAAETYLLTSSKPGYLDGGHGRIDPRGPGTPIALKDGEWLGDVRVTMSRPGSISGTVVDERGDPIVGAHVRVLPQVLIAGRTQWLAGAVASTDDRGAYRIPGLGPGSYVVSVPSVQATLPASATIKPPGAWAGTSMADLTAMSEAARAEKLVVDVGGGQQLVVGRYGVPPPPTPDGQRTAYPIAFYPNAAKPADAMPVELRVSEDRSGIDFQLQPVGTARVSGTLQGPPDAISNLLLRLIPVGVEELGQGSEAATTVSLADGRFTFLYVPSGSYVLDARHTLLELIYTSMENASTALPAAVPFPTRGASSSGVAAGPPGVQYSSLRDGADVSYWGQLRVDVSGQSVDDLVLPLRRPAAMSGRIVWAPGAKPSSNPPRPVLEPADGRRSLGIPSIAGLAPDDASTFTIEGLMAGEYFLRVGSAKVESITWNGEDYTDRPFDGSAGRDITGVLVTLTSATSSISGIVGDGNMTLTSAAAVIAFPVEREGWSNYGFNPRRLTSVLTTNDGRYRVDGLPVGEYYLIAVPASQERAWLDPSFLVAHAARASRVRVDRSDAKIASFSLSLVK